MHFESPRSFHFQFQNEKHISIEMYGHQLSFGWNITDNFVPTYDWVLKLQGPRDRKQCSHILEIVFQLHEKTPLVTFQWLTPEKGVCLFRNSLSTMRTPYQLFPPHAYMYFYCILV